MEANEFIFGIRAVIEAIESGRDIDTIYVRKGLEGDLAKELLSIIKERHLPIRRVPAERLNKFTRKNHQGVVATLSAIAYSSLGQIIPQLYEEGIVPLVIVLDGITDVRNFGAIARTAECCGANAIVIPERGSVSVQGDAVKTSAGALLHIPVCREHTVGAGVRFLKKNGFRIVAASEKADINYTKADFTEPVAIVMGAEDTGIQPEVLDLCDTKVSIPMFGHIGSLNVSVAAGVMLYEAVRQRLESNLEVI